jgi:hypothetical protein
MNELISRCLEARDTSWLAKVPHNVLLDHEIRWVQWILDFEKKHGEPPTLKRFMDMDEGFVQYRFASTPSEPTPPPLGDVLETTVKRKRLEEIERILYDAQVHMKREKQEPGDLMERLTALGTGFSGAQSFEATPLEEMWETPTEVGQIIEDILEERSLSLWFAPAKNMKTSTAYLSVFTVAAAVATWANEVLGRRVGRHGNVVIFNEQMGKTRALGKFRQIANGLGMKPEDPLPGVTLLNNTGLNLANPESVARLKATLVKHNALVCVFDSLTDVLPGRKMSQLDDYYPQINQLRALADEIDCSFVFISWPSGSGSAVGGPIQYGLYDMVLSFELKEAINELTIKRVVSREAYGWKDMVFRTSPTDQTEYFSLTPLASRVAKDEDEKKTPPRLSKKEKMQQEAGRMIMLLKETGGLGYTDWARLAVERKVVRSEGVARKRIDEIIPKTFPDFITKEDGIYRSTPAFDRTWGWDD